VETPGGAARLTRRPQISNNQDQLQERGNCHLLRIVTGEGSPISGDVPVSTICDRSRIDTDRSVLTLERLAARIHRSSGCRFQLVLAEQTRRPGMPAVLLTVP
jgi:hypothetical protein